MIDDTCNELASLSFFIIFVAVALSSKTWRINKLFQHARRFQRLELRERDVLIPFLFLTTCNVIVLLCWTIMSPLHFIRTVDAGTDRWNRVVSSTGSCSSEEQGGAIPYLVLLAMINMGAVVFANAQAYRARSIHTEYSESRYIALIMMCMLQSWLTGLPVLGLVYDTPRANYVVITFIVFLTCMAILLLMFVPKISYAKALRARETNTEKSNASRNKVCSNEESTAKTDVGLKVMRLDSFVGPHPFFASPSRILELNPSRIARLANEECYSVPENPRESDEEKQ